jgi:hypothetical protein
MHLQHPSQAVMAAKGSSGLRCAAALTALIFVVKQQQAELRNNANWSQKI